MKYVLPIAGWMMLCCASSWSVDFQGADAVLKQIAEKSAKPPGADKPADPVQELRTKLSAYRHDAPGFSPQAAAEQWLALFDAFSALPQQALNGSRNWRDRLTVEGFFEVLPPTTDWDALAKVIDAQHSAREFRDAALRVFAAILGGDQAAREAAFAALRKTVESSKLEDFQGTQFQQALDRMEDEMAALSADGPERIALFEKELVRREKGDENGELNGMMILPDLVKLAGEKKATELLRRVLALDVDVRVDGEATHRLAVSLALKTMAQRKKPLWALVTGVDDVPLFEALVKQFPAISPEEFSSHSEAGTIYLISLIASNRSKEAVAFLGTLSAGNLRSHGELLNRELTDYLVRKGLTRQVRDFLGEALAHDPGLPFWDDYIAFSARLGEADKALAFLRATASRNDLSPEAKEQTDQYYANALLAADRVEEGLKVLRAMVQAGPRSGRMNADQVAEEIRKNYARAGATLTPEMLRQIQSMSRGRADDGSREHVDRCLQLARLGRLLDRPELVGEGVKAAEGIVSKASFAESAGLVSSLVSFLMTVQRGPEAEHLIVEEQLKAPLNQLYLRPRMIELLVGVYHLAGRHEDVLKLLEESPDWNGNDLASLSGEAGDSVPILYAAAKAFAVAGRKEEARRVDLRLLENKGGYDPAYALLLELGGEDLEARLDALAARDRFEERPLIWKAKLQLDADRVEDAEKSARAAIAIDPSDGEEGKEDRMRAYAVLGDILEKKGDLEQAKIMRGAVAAIRLSENADDWWQAGLLTRSVKMYEEALGHFADAYCIQSRLALRYSELGDYAKAEQHYQRAFELMPDSFGRIESHCFGCEGAFQGDRAQSIADRVFTQLAVQTPTKPQVFYLLGYLRKEENRFEEAGGQFLHAVRIDPDYFNAWQQLYELPEDALLPQADTEAAVLAMLRLDPILHHHGADFQKVRDLRKLWDAILAAEKAQPPVVTGPLYPLAAAKAEHERRKKAMEAAGNRGFVPEDFAGAEMPTMNLRAQFAQQPALGVLARMIEMFSDRQ